MSAASQSRKRRGRESELVVADFLAAHGWPFATAVGSGAAGSDIRGVPFAVEVKSRTGLDLPALLRQMHAHTGGDRLCIGVVRLNGHGPATVADWPVVMTFRDFIALAHAAGITAPTTGHTQETP